MKCEKVKKSWKFKDYSRIIAEPGSSVNETTLFPLFLVVLYRFSNFDNIDLYYSKLHQFIWPIFCEDTTQFPRNVLSIPHH